MTSLGYHKTDEVILAILRKHNGYISGDELSQKTGLAKATITKHIHLLREEGYDIQCQPHLGYLLVRVPDRLAAEELSWQLHTQVIAQKILAYDTVDSTNTTAYALAEKGAGENTAVFAEGQRKGRGRFGRTWVSPQSQGVYCSLILRPEITSDQAALITLLAAVCCAETIRKVSGLKALIRWPNDVVIEDRKVCGILTEMKGRSDQVEFLIVGLGINVNTPLSQLPKGSTSLREETRTKKRLCRLEVARELLRTFDREYAAFIKGKDMHITKRWSNLSALSGKRIRVYLAHKAIEGQAQDIDAQGALILRLDNGFKQHIFAAEAIKVR